METWNFKHFVQLDLLCKSLEKINFHKQAYAVYIYVLNLSLLG